MSPFGRLTSTGFSIRRSLFRRDVERAFYSRKPFPLPKLKAVNAANLNNFKESYPFNFSAGPGEFASCREVFLQITDRSSVMQEAFQILNGQYYFPSGQNINTGNSFSWNKDYVSGYEWSRELVWKNDFFSFPNGTEIMNAWLPGRLYQLIQLGEGYMAEDNQDFVNKYLEILWDFKRENPIGTGIQWLDLKEISIRLINIIFSLPFFIHSELVDDKFVNDFLELLLLHSVYIENNLTSELQDYDYIISLAALAVSGVVFKEHDYGKRILYLTFSKAEEAARKMISPEGVPRSRSLPQLPVIAESFFLLRYSFSKASMKISKLFEERYSRMPGVIASLIMDDGTLAVIGEPVVGRIIPFTKDKVLFPLIYACYESGKERLKSLAPHPTPDILFFFGKEAVSEYRQIASSDYPRISYGYPQSGLFVLRNDDMHITVDAEPVSSAKKKTAGHNDILSFELFYKGQHVISDPGMYSVYSEPSIRETLRSVTSHSTLYIDDQEPVEFEGIFSIREDLTNPKITEWHSDEYSDLLSVQHYAYARFADPVIIKRIFRLLKEENKLIIRDELFGGSTHKAVSHLVFHPDVLVEQQENNFFKLYSPVTASITISSPHTTLSSVIQENLYAPSFGIVKQTKKIATTFTTQFPVYLTTEITFK